MTDLNGRPELPYDFSDAKRAVENVHVAQKMAETGIKDAARGLAEAERSYRKALAETILKLRADGQPVTVAADLARGTDHVADLRFHRDVAEGVYRAAQAAVWRHTADRRELEQLIDWSRRVSPDGQYEEPRR